MHYCDGCGKSLDPPAIDLNYADAIRELEELGDDDYAD